MRLLVTPLLVLLAVGHCFAADPVVPLGAGSYTTALPVGAKAPPDDDLPHRKRRRQDAHERLVEFAGLDEVFGAALSASAGGARRGRPACASTTPARRSRPTATAIFGSMPGRTGDDLILGHSAQDEFPDARVDGFSDWFVTARFASDKRSMTVSYGHGSPFVYALYEGGDPRVDFPAGRRRSGPATRTAPCWASRSTANTTVCSARPDRPGPA